MQGYLVAASEMVIIGTLPNPLSPRPAFCLSEEDSQETDFSDSSEQTAIDQDARKPLALVVDDAPDLAEMLSVFLTHAGYEVVTAESARAAIAAAEVHSFDVIISDIGMPQMNGYQLAQVLRALPAYSSVPMIAVSGFSMYDDRERSLSSGFNAHVTKPIDPMNLFELIEQLRG